MRVALVHEYLNQFGGAERLLQVLCSIFPNAPIYTLFYDANATGKIFEDRVIRTSFLQKAPFINQRHTLFPLLMPIAIEQFDFSDFDLVISVSASFAKGIITKPGTRHICYCLTPPRFLWDGSQKFIEGFNYPGWIKKILPPFMSYLRIWDIEASQRVDEFWAISKFVKERILKYYGKDSKVIYPPVDVNKFYLSDKKDNYFFAVGRLVPYKRFDLIVDAFNELGEPLIIAGTGPELKKLKKIAKSNIKFIGLVSDSELAELYSKAKAFIFPQEEDFGMTPVEAMASGCPVIAYESGGASETIIENKTGIFFKEQTKESIIAAIKNFNPQKINKIDCRNRAEEFSVRIFQDNINNILSSDKLF